MIWFILKLNLNRIMKFRIKSNNFLLIININYYNKKKINNKIINSFRDVMQIADFILLDVTSVYFSPRVLAASIIYFQILKIS